MVAGALDFETAVAELDGGGKCNMLSNGGGFLGANAMVTLGLFAMVAVGGGGKSNTLFREGYAKELGADPGGFPALNLRARACAAEYGLWLVDAPPDFAEVPTPNEGKLSLVKSGAREEGTGMP